MTNFLRIPFNLFRPVYKRTSFHRSVVEEVGDEHLREAYMTCRAITRRHARTFYMATRFLPNPKQRSIFAIYGLCRYIDDLVDEAEDLVLQEKLDLDGIKTKLEEWKEMLNDTYEGKRHDNPILLAFSDVLKNYSISVDLPFKLMDGIGMDLYKSRYETFEEVYDYAYKVASTVGLMTSEVFGYSSEKALDYAVDLGIAMQLTNILRDMGEDLRRNRIYLPKEDLDRFNIRERDLFNHTLDVRFINMLEFQISRTRAYYKRADKGISLLSKDSRLPVYLARFNYSRILDKIEESRYNVFAQRAYLNSTEKLTALPRVLYRIQFRLPAPGGK